jgi:hypothetical protein
LNLGGYAARGQDQKRQISSKPLATRFAKPQAVYCLGVQKVVSKLTTPYKS